VKPTLIPAPTVERFERPGAYALASGESLPRLSLAYRTWGTPSPARDNAVVVCHALTGSADADHWWSALFGPGHALDPERDFVVCANVLGGCYGSTGPSSPGPDGRPWRSRFPAITVTDIVRSQQHLLDALGVTSIRLVVGGSLGGMQALEWALLDPRVEAAAVIAAPARHDAWAIAWSEAQRTALAAAPWRGRGPDAGLAAARAVAMVSYRAADGLGARFGRRPGERNAFAVQDWLAHHGRTLTARFDRHTYRVLLDAMDAHDVGAGRGGVERALGTLARPVLVLGIRGDTLYPRGEIAALAEALPQGELAWLETPHGHDGFLIEAAEVNALVRDFRRRSERQERRAGGAA
jgi:homoserine O-acetyltransferase